LSSFLILCNGALPHAHIAVTDSENRRAHNHELVLTQVITYKPTESPI
jgi:hypothetical protein